jgi:hypothetical protein
VKLSARARITATWGLLMAATLVSWFSARDAGNLRVATAIVLVISFAKMRYIGLEFMELRRAPLPLRIAFEVWGPVVCAVLLALYWLSAPL